MKLILDWDEGTIDLVIIAVGSSYLCNAQETWNEIQKFNPFSPEEDGIYPVRELLGSHEARLLKEEL